VRPKTRKNSSNCVRKVNNCVRKVNNIKNKEIFGGNPDNFSIYNTKGRKSLCQTISYIIAIKSIKPLTTPLIFAYGSLIYIKKVRKYSNHKLIEKLTENKQK